MCPHPCPATEPLEVPQVPRIPVPPPGLDARRPAVHPLDRERRGRRVGQHRGHRADTAGRRQDHPWLAGVRGRGGEPVRRRRRRSVPYAGHGTFVRRGPALRRPEGIGLRRAGIRHRGRRLRDEARVQPGGRPRPRPGHPRVHLHLGHPPRSVPAHLRRLLRKAHPPHEGPRRARARRQRRRVTADVAGRPPGRDRRGRPGRELAATARTSATTAGGSMSTRRAKTSSTPSPRAPTCAPSRPTSGNAGSSTAWPCGAGRRSAPRWSPG